MKPLSANPDRETESTASASSPPLKILVVVEPCFAGAFAHVDGLIHYLLEQNQQVHLAYSSQRTSPRLAPVIECVTKHGGKCLDLNVGNAPRPGDLSAFLRLRRFAQEIRPDIIHSHSSKAGVLARALAWAGIGARQIYTPHAYYGLGSRGGLMDALYNWIERIFGRVGETITVSEDEREFAIHSLKIDPDRCLLIPIAVDTDKFFPATPEEKATARVQLGLPQDAVILGWMGRLSFQKNPQSLLRAFAKIDPSKSKCHLLQIGLGEEEESVNRLAQELGLAPNLTRIASVTESEKFYQAIDGLILTSRYEACPTVVIEALSANLPLVLTRATGTNWLGRHNLSHVWYASPDDDLGLAQAIMDWQAGIPSRRPSNHRERALELFSIAKVYGTILEAYRARKTAWPA